MVEAHPLLAAPRTAVTPPIKVFINVGHASADNGAKFPGTVFRELAAAVGVEAQWGRHFGDDFLEVQEEDWPIVEQLLTEAKMLYRRADDSSRGWRNVTPGSRFELYLKALARQRAEVFHG